MFSFIVSPQSLLSLHGVGRAGFEPALSTASRPQRTGRYYSPLRGITNLPHRPPRSSLAPSPATFRNSLSATLRRFRGSCLPAASYPRLRGPGKSWWGSSRPTFPQVDPLHPNPWEPTTRRRALPSTASRFASRSASSLWRLLVFRRLAIQLTLRAPAGLEPADSPVARGGFSSFALEADSGSSLPRSARLPYVSVRRR